MDMRFFKQSQKRTRAEFRFFWRCWCFFFSSFVCLASCGWEAKPSILYPADLATLAKASIDFLVFLNKCSPNNSDLPGSLRLSWYFVFHYDGYESTRCHIIFAESLLQLIDGRRP
jgi:hypothetical protein